METSQRFIEGLSELLTVTNAPLEWLNSDKVDLKDLFIKMKESGKINAEIYNQLTYSFTKKACSC
ncbi:hypothetical protein ACLNAR_26410 [Priestia aryabhattai]|uniref:hypothetical protein n=1 Tax=Priestia aryabhattai TaxID=412384 RepID=UPI00398F0E43